MDWNQQVFRAAFVADEHDDKTDDENNDIMQRVILLRTTDNMKVMVGRLCQTYRIWLAGCVAILYGRL